MWRNACLLLWLSSVVAVHGSEVDCTKRLDVISPEAWATLRELDYNMLSVTKIVNVAQMIIGNSNYPSPHIAWHTADSRTYLQGDSPCFATGHGFGPRELVELQRRGVKDIQFGGNFIVILASDGTIWTGGCNNSGFLGHHGTETRPVLSQVPGLPPMKRIAVTSSNVLALANNGEMYSWGSSILLGYRSYDIANPSPKKISLAQGGPTPKTIDVCCGDYHCAMLTEDSKAFSWGIQGFIGRPVPEHYSPGLVAGIPEGQRISKVACGERHALAVTTSGRLFGWGYNDDGSLMNTGDTETHATELYMGGKIVRDVAASQSTSLVVTDNGHSYFFGLYWRHSWYSPEPTVDHVEFPRDIMAAVQRFRPCDEQTFGAVSLGCK